MADYKQSNIVGQKWNRFSRIVIDNPRSAAPSVMCVEQEVISLGDDEVVRDIGNLSFPFNPAEEFDILDPSTNMSTGQTASGAMVYALVYSFVMGQALKRDVPVEPVAVEPEPVVPAPAP